MAKNQNQPMLKGGPMQKHRGITLERLNLFLKEEDQFTSLNLIPHLYKKKLDGEEWIQMTHYAVPNLQRISFEEAMKGDFKEAHRGDQFGPSWSTHWFHIHVKLPNDWSDEEVQFRWNSWSEVLIWSEQGEPIQALTGEGGGNQREEYTLTSNSKGGEKFSFYLEVACNGLFGNGRGMIGPPEERVYPVQTAEIAIPNKLAVQLKYDFEIVRDFAREFPEKDSRGMRALRVANKVINLFQRDGSDECLKACLKITKEFLSIKGAVNRHELIAVGHCHIDTAWLWPYDETKRKCARSWSTQLQLMDANPDFKFVCSQAQQFEWLKQLYPGLFKCIQQKTKEGQFMPIGGTWVEMDCNLPSGEAFCRQFLLGQRFFEQNFGKRCQVFWLPDTFGYSSQLPQIIKQADMKYFFTQKLSWNNINKFPHTTFNWVGLDGTKVLAHMAPGESYNSQVWLEEVRFAESNNKDKDIINSGLFVYGNGDGGGGPLPSMLERAQRMKDVDGLAKLTMGSVDTFYDKISKCPEVNDLPEWHGELYLELHRGTYTSHGSIKKYNRYTELLLREAEYLATLAKIYHNISYPTAEFARLWKLVCLNQFHDVLPGSAIGMVYKDALNFYRDVVKSADAIIEHSLNVITPPNNSSKEVMLINTLGWSRSEVVKVPAQYNLSSIQSSGGDNYVLIENIPPHTLSYMTIQPQQDTRKRVKVVKDQEYFILSNEYLECHINSTGQIVSLIDKKVGREVISKNQLANQFNIYEDIPLYWDAWDVEVYHLEKYKSLQAYEVHINEKGPLVASLIVKYKISDDSSINQIIKLTATSDLIEFITEVDWHENREFLKVEFPVAVHNDYATYDTQFGVIHRPTHHNTSWDLAKFEVCGHKFADLSDSQYGVAIVNDSKYGYATQTNTIRLSLLRAPKAPDDECDMGRHTIRYAIYPHQFHFGNSNVVQRAHEFNTALRHRLPPPASDIPQLLSKPNSLFILPTTTSVILDTLKISEDNNNHVIVRLYESMGAQVTNFTLATTLPIKNGWISNIMEDSISPLSIANDNSMSLTFTPFQLITLKFQLSNL